MLIQRSGLSCFPSRGQWRVKRPSALWIIGLRSHWVHPVLLLQDLAAAEVDRLLTPGQPVRVQQDSEQLLDLVLSGWVDGSMLGWVGTLINKSWLDRQRGVHPAERKTRCGPVRKDRWAVV